MRDFSRADARVNICHRKEVAEVPQIQHDVWLVPNCIHENGVDSVHKLGCPNNEETGERDHDKAREQDA